MSETKTACTHVWPLPDTAALRFDGVYMVGFHCARCGHKGWGYGGQELNPLSLVPRWLPEVRN